MKKHFFILLFLFYNISTNAQNIEYLVKPTFELEIAYPFLNGLSKVVNKSSYKGFVDRQGNIAIPLQYALVSQYNGFVILEDINRKWTFIDNKGKKIDTLKVKVRRQAKNGLKWIDLNGKVNVTDTLDQPIKIWQWEPRNMDFFYLPDFNLSIEPPGEEVINRISNQDSEVNKKVFDITLKDGKYGIKNINGGIVIPFIYDDLTYCDDKTIKVKIGEKFGLLDILGRIILPIEYDEILNFHEEITGIRKADKWGFINKSGDIIVPLIYQRVHSFSEGIARVQKNNKWGLINALGNEIIPCKYQEIDIFNGEYARIKQNSLYGLVNKKGKEILPAKYESIEAYKGDYASIIQNGEKKTIELSGKEIKKFGNIWNGFFDGMASFTSLGFHNADKYRNMGFINKKGDIIIPPEYAAPYPFSEGYVFVRKNRTLLMMDKLGKVIAQYDSTYTSSTIMTNGLALIEFYGKGPVFVDKSGKVILKFPIDKFDEIVAFSEGLAWVRKGKKWGCINKKGEMVIPFEFDDTCKYFSEGLAWVKLSGKWGIIKSPLAKSKIK